MVTPALILPGIGNKNMNRPYCFIQKAIHYFQKKFSRIKLSYMGKPRP